MISDTITKAVHSPIGDILAHGIGTTIVVVLITLFVIREVASAYAEPPADYWARRLNKFVIPLLVAFSLVIAVRFARLLT